MAASFINFLRTLRTNVFGGSELSGRKATGFNLPGMPGSDSDTSYYCPCCETESPDFLNWNEEYKGVICPVCDSRPRHRLFWLFASEFRLFHPHYGSILHLAPEPMLKPLMRLTPDVQYVTGDLHLPAMDVRMDLTKAPFPDQSFDVILCCHVLEVVNDDSAALREIQRILKPGGWAWIQVWVEQSNLATLEDPAATSPGDRLRLYGHETCSRLYGHDYGKRVEASGLTFHAFPYAHDRIGPRMANRYRVEPETQLFFATRGQSKIDALMARQ